MAIRLHSRSAETVARPADNRRTAVAAVVGRIAVAAAVDNSPADTALGVVAEAALAVDPAPLVPVAGSSALAPLPLYPWWEYQRPVRSGMCRIRYGQ